MIRSAIRGLLRVASETLAAGLREALRRDDDYTSAGKPQCDWDDATAREALVDALARDAYAVLSHIDGLELDPTVREAAALVATVVGQDLEKTDDGRFRIARRVAPDRVISTVDPEARHGHKTSARGFDGYKGHVSVDPDSEIITATAVTPGNAADGSVTEKLLGELVASQTPEVPASSTPRESERSTPTSELTPSTSHESEPSIPTDELTPSIPTEELSPTAAATVESVGTLDERTAGPLATAPAHRDEESQVSERMVLEQHAAPGGSNSSPIHATLVSPHNGGATSASTTRAADAPRPVVYGDAAYGTAENLILFLTLCVVANVKVPAPSARKGLFSKDDFDIDLAAGTVRCPAEQLVQIRRMKDGSAIAEFGAACALCSLAPKCTESKSGRTIRLHAHEAILAEARERQADPSWKADYKATRPKVERKQAHMMRRRHGGRRARVRGEERVGQDFSLLAAAINLQRLAVLGIHLREPGSTGTGAPPRPDATRGSRSRRRTDRERKPNHQRTTRGVERRRRELRGPHLLRLVLSGWLAAADSRPGRSDRPAIHGSPRKTPVS